MPVDLTPLINLGAIGCVLAWFLWQTNPRLEKIERAIDRLSRSIMLDLISRPDTPEPLKEQARAIVREVENQGKRQDL